MDFDDIVVGAGSSGATLAARLSEDPARKVLLLEAGPDYPSLAATPADLRGPDPSLRDHDWQLRAEATPGQRIPFPRGKVVGGCSAVNGAVALRGMPADYDEWAALGNASWAWSEVLPYFKKLEDDDLGASALHGTGGPIPIRRCKPDAMCATQRAAFDGYRSLGFAEVVDHNHPDATGVGPIPMNLRDNIRVSTALGYLLPARGRQNLVIRGGVTVERVVIVDGRATGVEVLCATGRETIAAERVTLCAGAIHSPAILVRSGIGPREDLRSLGIECVRDLPGVGTYLVDHPGAGIYAIPRSEAQGEADPNHQVMVRYTTPGSSEQNDMQLYVFGRIPLKGTRLEKTLGARPYLVSASLVRPRSTGRLHITSSDPEAAPGVELNFCKDAEDMRRMASGFRQCWQLLRETAFSERIAEVPVWTDELVRSDALESALRRATGTAYHPVATARMGKQGDERAVVDEHCRVHGIENLRVVDASVMPSIPRANTNLPCIMIAERIAERMRT